jgi:hypothetical protein
MGGGRLTREVISMPATGMRILAANDGQTNSSSASGELTATSCFTTFGKIRYG